MAGKKILVADDSLTIQKVIRLALSGDGYEIQTVSDGKEAIEQASLFRPDICIIDVSLPHYDAYQIREHFIMKPDLKNIPVILMSSAFEKVDETRAEKLGFAGHLIKPFDPSHLRSTLLSVASQAPKNDPVEAMINEPIVPPSQTISFDPPSFQQPQHEMPPVDLELEEQGYEHDPTASPYSQQGMQSPPPPQYTGPKNPQASERTNAGRGQTRAPTQPQNFQNQQHAYQQAPIQPSPQPQWGQSASAQNPTFEEQPWQGNPFDPPIAPQRPRNMPSAFQDEDYGGNNPISFQDLPPLTSEHSKLGSQSGHGMDDIQQLARNTFEMSGLNQHDWGMIEPGKGAHPFADDQPQAIDISGNVPKHSTKPHPDEVSPFNMHEVHNSETAPNYQGGDRITVTGAELEAIVKSEVGKLLEQMNAQVHERVESELKRYAQELMPALAERIIKEEIRKLLANPPL